MSCCCLRRLLGLRCCPARQGPERRPHCRPATQLEPALRRAMDADEREWPAVRALLCLLCAAQRARCRLRQPALLRTPPLPASARAPAACRCRHRRGRAARQPGAAVARACISARPRFLPGEGLRGADPSQRRHPGQRAAGGQGYWKAWREVATAAGRRTGQRRPQLPSPPRPPLSPPPPLPRPRPRPRPTSTGCESWRAPARCCCWRMHSRSTRRG